MEPTSEAPRPPLADTSADQALRAVHAERLCERVREGSYVVDSSAVAGALLERLLGR